MKLRTFGHYPYNFKEHVLWPVSVSHHKLSSVWNGPTPAHYKENFTFQILFSFFLPQNFPPFPYL